ncbi:hypothetical protein Tco_1224187, partial [Tanacetum coccineum]
LYTIEFQKSGLSLCYTLLWVDSSNKIRDAIQINEYISTEIHDPVEDPRGYKVVTELMMHRPCGVANLGTTYSTVRLTYVHSNSDDLFYFWLLLCHQKGCKSPTEVRTVNGKVLPTYRATCEALGLLGDDKEWDIALEESTVSASSTKVRTLFGQILIYCDVSVLPNCRENTGQQCKMTSQPKYQRQKAF